MKTVRLEVTLDQAQAIAEALDLYTRMGLGQLEEITDLVRSGMIPMHVTTPKGSYGDPVLPSIEVCEQIEALMKRVRGALGFEPGCSRGVGHPHNPIATTRAYEIMKVLNKVLAEARDPNPRFRGVNYDGLGPRYTRDPAPRAWIEESVPAPSSGTK